ncbi:MAG: GMC family oxidoreductase, partial [Deltaproteobacteria bacterium]|nr:GMC family oxidoreductase [Deltaproteobacteria bacterium]
VMGTTRMGKDPKTSVVDSDGRCHHTENLYVSDTGVLPMSPAVNPMHTLMAIADRIAARVHSAI